MCVEWTSLHRQAAEAVAQAIYGAAYSVYLVRERVKDGLDARPDKCAEWANDTAARNPAPTQYLILASLWLGHLEAANPNERGLAGIVRAGNRAACAADPTCGTSSTHTDIDIPAFFSALALEAIAKGSGCLPDATDIDCPRCNSKPHYTGDGRLLDIPPLVISIEWSR